VQATSLLAWMVHPELVEGNPSPAANLYSFFIFYEMSNTIDYLIFSLKGRILKILIILSFMTINLMPKTILGRWSVGLIVLFLLLLVLFHILVASGQRGGETFFSNPYLAFTGIFIAMSGISSFFTGIFSIIRNKERSILVFLSTLIGLFVLLFVFGEILFPH